MPDKISISKDIHDLWLKMRESNTPITNEQLKTLYGKTVPAPLKAEMIDRGLIMLITKSPQTYKAKNVDPALIEIMVETKPAGGAPKAKKTSKSEPSPSKQIKLDIEGSAAPEIEASQSVTNAAFDNVMMQVAKFCKPYFDRIEELTAEIGEIKKALQNIGYIGVKADLPKVTQSVSRDAFLSKVRQASTKLNERHNFGGEIPLPDLWVEITRILPEMTWTSFKDFLFLLSDDRCIDLHVANDPSKVQHPDKGINIPGRGLVYYVALRD